MLFQTHMPKKTFFSLYNFSELESALKTDAENFQVKFCVI